MSKKNITLLIIVLILLMGGTILCAVRWKVWFGNPQEPQWEGDTIAYQFYTFAQDSVPGFVYKDCQWQDVKDPDSLVFILLGDVHNQVDSMQWEAMAQRHPNIDFYAQLGDFIDRGYFYYAQQLISELEGTPFAQLPLVVTPGNHEYHKGIVRRLPQLWHDLFPQPLNGPERFKGSTFFIDFPALRFIAIDTNGLQRLSDYTRVNFWVRNALNTADGRFTVVMMHHPVYASAKGRFNLGIYLTFARLLRKADVVFSGHDHTYARRMPFIGTVSTRKFKRIKDNHNWESSCTDKQLYEVVSISQDTLRINTYLIDSGELFDSVKITHSPTLSSL